MKVGKKRFCILFAVVFLLTVCSAALFISFGASHLCCGAGCAVCRDISGLKLLARILGVSVSAGALGFGVFAVADTYIRRAALLRRADTLITRKTELLR